MAQFPNTTAADGIWTLKKVRRAILGGNWPAYYPPDEYFANTVLLLNGDGTNGGQNNTFLDSSSNAHTITRNGNVTQGSFSPFAKDDGKWGVYFDGTDDYLSLGSNVISSTGQFSAEAFVYNSSSQLDDRATIFSQYTGGVSGRWLLWIDNGTLEWIESGDDSIRDNTAFPQDSWVHVLLTRDASNVVRLFVDGELRDYGTNTASLDTSNFEIGNDSGVTNDAFKGYISNVRAVDGSIPLDYQTSSTTVGEQVFTPPTEPLTAISGTSLLTCQSNRFVDNSTNAHAITVTGTPKVTTFSPFPQTLLPYSADTNGGSGYFDGTGDYLQCNEALDGLTSSSDPFTVEFRFYCTEIPASSFITMIGINSADGSANELLLSVASTNTLAIHYAAEARQELGTVNANTWHHVAAVFDGTDLNVYLDGSVIYTRASKTPTGPLSDDVFFIGTEIDAGPSFGNFFNGYISDVRVTESAVYTSAFTPPTAPLTAVTNTSLLCNFTNASITDLTGSNVLETVGNAQVDTAVKKYGTGALEFDGTGDYLESKSNLEAYQFGTGDFTVECWVNKSGQGSNGYDGVAKLGTGSAASDGWYLEVSTNRGIYFTIAGGTVIYGTWTNDSAWHHIAVTRDSGTVRIFLDGTVVQTGTLATAVPTTGTSFFVGDNFTGTHYYFNGFMDDLRITKGIARYTANFTPPTASHEIVGA